MYKTLLILLVLVTSCSQSEVTDQPSEAQNNENSPKPIDNQSKETKLVDEVEQAKRWLVDAIDRQFNYELQSFKVITTEEYYELKSDLINSNFVHGIDLDSIRKKWSYKYDISSDDIDVGFLIDAQDNGQIEIESCELLNQLPNSNFVFGVSLYDTLFKAQYKSDITVIPYKESYAIDYVKEHWK
jgi:hypothetical protein